MSFRRARSGYECTCTPRIRRDSEDRRSSRSLGAPGPCVIVVVTSVVAHLAPVSGALAITHPLKACYYLTSMEKDQDVRESGGKSAHEVTIMALPFDLRENFVNYKYGSMIFAWITALSKMRCSCRP